VAIAIVVLLFAVLDNWNTSQYAITPGDATPVAPLVKITGVSTASHQGTVLFTDVYLQSLTALQWITFHFQSNVQFVNADELVDPGVPTAELDAQGYLEMSDSKQAAEVTAFRSLGWKVPATPTGTVVTGVVDPSPAYQSRLRVGDEITGVNGTPIRSACAMVRFTHQLAPKTKLNLTVRRVKISNAGVLTYGATKNLVVHTAVEPSGLGTSGCSGVFGVDRSWIGISVEDGISYALPATVSINTANIGGPSAGLAMTLTMIDKLSRDSITGHRVIAATGTISVGGAVGDVGGVAQKTVAVQRAGASYFIVPEVEVATARAVARPGLRILGVTSLAQALKDLQRLGGAAPVPISKPS
jgi:PDZ domain-containing protein